MLGLQERGVLALWVTNRERHRRFVDAELLSAWGLCHVAIWHWLKVTDDGQLVSPLVTLCAMMAALQTHELAIFPSLQTLHLQVPVCVCLVVVSVGHGATDLAVMLLLLLVKCRSVIQLACWSAGYCI